ncbi:MAG: hypothetical protein R2712_15590 [Vicinamibacterales bacterium]
MWTVLALSLAAAAGAAPVQTPQAPDTAATTSTVEQPATGAAIDASKLGVSLDRIQEALRQSSTRQVDTGNPLRLEYQVQVYGASPRIDVIQDFDIGQNAPLQYGAPTHQDFINQWTPQAFRAPAAPLSSLAGWALFQLAKRSDKSKCEKELEEYRALVMQGVAVAAPRCSQ